MSKIKGSDIIVMMLVGGDWKVAAYGTTCEIDVNASTIQVSNPSSGKWPRNKVKGYSWQVTCGTLISDAGDGLDIFDMLKDGVEVLVTFTSVDSHVLPVSSIAPYVPNTKFRLEGNALVTRYTASAKRGDHATASATFLGSGELNKVTNI